jgi:hypothetical protein
MIYHLDPKRFYTHRGYLLQWVHQDALVITENDFENIEYSKHLFKNYPLSGKPVIVDVSHNPWQGTEVPLNGDLTLTGDISYFYNPTEHVVFFPIFVWMNSLRANLWQPNYTFDAPNNKTRGAMCLNNIERTHRTQLYNLLQPIVDQMVYTYSGSGLPGEENKHPKSDISVEHVVYSQCAVNVVTETESEFAWVSEKICKPFIARQIPVIVAGPGVNKFLQDIGLDMFSDIVPWLSWDDETDTVKRVKKIAEFLIDWTNRGSMLEDYYSVIDRVEGNKQYFHSEKFRNLILAQTNQIKF